MGREWLYKASDGTKRVKRKTRKEENNTSSSSSSGCMTAIFKLFDIQHHQFRFHHPSSFISESAIDDPQTQLSLSHLPIHHGVEAPRNSLESPDDVASTAHQQPNLKIPMLGIQIKTKGSRFSDDLSSECSGSPGTKTPNLVARLMGLDLLPECSSPRPSSSSTPLNSHNYRSRSLPTTPRISTASRRSTDNAHHRLSLQIDKENCSFNSKRSELPVIGQDDDSTSHYAKQIANQVRERISRRLGTDITNTVSARNKDQRRDSNLVLLKPNKPSSSPMPASKTKRDESTPSPKLKLLDKPISNLQSSSSSSSCLKKLEESKAEILYQRPVKDKKVRRMASERYDLRLKKQEEVAFVSKMCNKKKSTPPPLPEHVVRVKNATKFLSVKKEMTSSSTSTTTRLPQKQVSFASILLPPAGNLNSSYNPNDTHSPVSSAPSTSAGPFSDYVDYIASILHHCGIHVATPISRGQWYSPSHPLHPSIFHRLEKLHHPIATTAKRKMIFELVDELLAEILKPYTNLKPRPPDSCGSDLIRKLCERIGSIPAAECQVMEDIEGLIDRDMGRSMQRLSSTAFEAEAAEIVKEMECEILETLVHEMARVT